MTKIILKISYTRFDVLCYSKYNITCFLTSKLHQVYPILFAREGLVKTFYTNIKY